MTPNSSLLGTVCTFEGVARVVFHSVGIPSKEGVMELSFTVLSTSSFFKFIHSFVPGFFCFCWASLNEDLQAF